MPHRFVYYLAASADGFIARPDGSVDWLESRPAEDYGFKDFIAGIGTVVWGRTTFDQVGAKGLEPFGPRLQHIVLTHRPGGPLPPGARVQFTREPVAQLCARLRAEGGKDVWVMGGAGVAGAILEAGELDEVFVHVIPVLLGQGIPMFRAGSGNVELELVDSFAHKDGVLRLRYAVKGRAQARVP